MRNESIDDRRIRLRRMLSQVDTELDGLCGVIGNSTDLLLLLRDSKDLELEPKTLDEELIELALKITYYTIAKRGLELELNE